MTRTPRYLLASILVLITLHGGCGFVSQETTVNEKIQARGTELVGLLQSGQYEALAGRFHYPPDYTSQQLAEDRTGIARSVAFLAEEFGPFAMLEPPPGMFKFSQLEVSASDFAYWEAQPNKGQGAWVRYRVMYDKAGPGSLRFTFYNQSDALEVRSIHFELDASQDGAEQTVHAIGTRLASALQIPFKWEESGIR